MVEGRYDGFVPGIHQIEGYGGLGFRFAGMSHRGSILALPSGIYAWTPELPEEITSESLGPLWSEPSGAIELLLIGSGQQLKPPSSAIRSALQQQRIRVDAMGTGAAISTYNILLGERRRVAAALLAVP